MHFFEGLEFGAVDFLGLPGVVLWLILLALFFDFLNGFHDAANSIATVVSTRVLTPQAAVIWAAFFNFVAFLIFPLGVAKTMQAGIIEPWVVDRSVIAATLIAACAWDLITWYYGLPTSSSHALIGGMVGAALAKHGWEALVWQGFWAGLGGAMTFIILAPLIGLTIGMTIAIGVTWLFRRVAPRQVDGTFRRGQLLSAALYSLGHGGNDAQKTMGIIYALLVATTYANGQPVLAGHEHPTEVVLACHLAMGLGTLFGGWRIVKTMGQRLLKLKPVDGFCAETGAAATLVLTIFFKMPVSTTHTITGSILGVGAARYRLSAVRWGVAGRVVWAWILTIPGAALISGVSWWLLNLFG